MKSSLFKLKKLAIIPVLIMVVMIFVSCDENIINLDKDKDAKNPSNDKQNSQSEKSKSDLEIKTSTAEETANKDKSNTNSGGVTVPIIASSAMPAVPVYLKLDTIEIEGDYEFLSFQKCSKYIDTKDGKKLVYGLISAEGEVVVPFIYDSFEMLENDGYDGSDSALVSKGVKFGVIQPSDGEEVLKCIYDKIIPIYSDEGIYCYIVSANGKYGVFDNIGEEMISIKYDLIEEYMDGIFLVYLNGKYGLIDYLGKEIAGLKYNDKNDLKLVNFLTKEESLPSSKKYSFIDKAFIFKVQNMKSYKNGVGVSIDETKLKRFNEGGTVFNLPKYIGFPNGYFDFETINYINHFNNGHEDMYHNSKLSIYDSRVLPPDRRDENPIEIFSLNKENTADLLSGKLLEEADDPRKDANASFSIIDGKLIKGGKWGYIDESGKEFFADCTFIDGFFNNLARYEIKDGKKSKWGYLEAPFEKGLSARVSIQPTFEYADNFYNSLARVKVADGKWGYIDTRGKLSIPATFDYCENFSKNSPYARVIKDGKWGVLYMHDVIEPEIKYDYIQKSIKSSTVNRDEEFKIYILGIGDEKSIKYGTSYIPLKYNKLFIDPYFASYIATIIEGDKIKYGRLSSRGDIIIPFEYDYLNYYLGFNAHYYYIAKKDDKYSLFMHIDKKISETEFDYISDSKNILKRDLGTLYSTKEDYAKVFNTHFVKKDGKWKIIRVSPDSILN